MDLNLTEEQEMIVGMVRRFVREEIVPLELDLDPDADELKPADHERLVEMTRGMGLYGLGIPPEYGGPDIDLVTQTLIAIEISQHRAGLYAPCYGAFGGAGLAQLFEATDDQKERYLYPTLKGEKRGFFGLSEPSGGSDPARAIQTRAVQDGDDWVINGSKLWISGADRADYGLVFARTDPDKGRWGISAFLVDGDTPGFTRGPAQRKMGLNTSPMGDLVMDECRVAAAQRLGPEGAGLSIFNHSMEWERSFIFASHVGSMARQLDEAVAHARGRRQFGQPIGRFQSVSNRIADMKLRLETCRLLLHKAAWMMDQGEDTKLISALAKLQIGESFFASSIEAMRVHGGRGYMHEQGIERDVRDAAGGVIYSGTSDIQRQLIAKLLGL